MSSLNRLPPSELARDTIEALRAERGAPRWFIYWTVLTVVLGGLLLLPFIKVNVTVSGPGLVRPDGELGEVRSAISGVIASVAVTEHQRVSRGQNLIEIASPVLNERRELNRLQNHEVATELVDLDALLAGAGPNDHDWRSGVWAVAALRRRAMEETHLREMEQKRREMERVIALHARGLVSDRDAETARHAVAQSGAAHRLAISDLEAGWQAERLRLQQRHDFLVVEARQLTEELALHRVVAPVEGDLFGVDGLRPGQFVTAGESLAVVSPVGRLRIDARVDSRAVGFLREGLRARVQFDAFPHTEWGALEGQVESIAPDALAKDAAAHRVIVRLESEALQRNDGARAELKKGMSARVRFIVTRRSLWHLLTQDAADWLERKSKWDSPDQTA